MAKLIVTDVFGQTVLATFASWDHVTLHSDMKAFDDAGVWALALILGLMGASCTTPKSSVLLTDKALIHEQPATASHSRG